MKVISPRYIADFVYQMVEDIVRRNKNVTIEDLTREYPTKELKEGEYVMVDIELNIEEIKLLRQFMITY